MVIKTTYIKLTKLKPQILFTLTKSRRMWWAVHVARMGVKINIYRLLVGKSEGKRQLGRLRRRWEDNIKMDPNGVEWEDIEWIYVAQDRNQWEAILKLCIL
jgi:hypothetical protein